MTPETRPFPSFVPAKKKTTRKAAKKPVKSFEETLWHNANLGEVPADTFFKDQHPDLKADTTTRGSANPIPGRSQTADRPRSEEQPMANPPFTLKDWRGPDTAMRGSAKLQPEDTPQFVSEAKDKLVHDGRWDGYDTPPTGNANYTWILHMVSKLSGWSGATKTIGQGYPKGERGGANQNGVASFVLTNGSMSTNTKSSSTAAKAEPTPSPHEEKSYCKRDIRQSSGDTPCINERRASLPTPFQIHTDF